MERSLPRFVVSARQWRSLQLPHASYTSMHLKVIAVLHYNNYEGDIHACVLIACISSKYSKCISAIKRILYTTAMYISSSSFVYLRFSLYCDACLKSSVLRVGVKTLHNTYISHPNSCGEALPWIAAWFPPQQICYWHGLLTAPIPEHEFH